MLENTPQLEMICMGLTINIMIFNCSWWKYVKFPRRSRIPPCQGSTATSCSISLVHLKVSKAPGQVHMVHDHGWPWIHGQRVDTRPGKRSHITMEKNTMLLIEQSTISMGHGFNSYVKLNYQRVPWYLKHLGSKRAPAWVPSPPMTKYCLMFLTVVSINGGTPIVG